MADRNMMLTMDEYMDLRQLLASEKESEGAKLEARLAKPKKRKTTKYQKELGRQLERQNSMKRKKNGQLKKGQTAGSILSAAHKATRRALK